jgi:hypothetical protein
MIYVIATIEVKPGKRAAFLTEFHRNVPNVLAEKGCIEYGPTVDLKTEIKAQIPLRGEMGQPAGASGASCGAAHARVPGAGEGDRGRLETANPRAKVRRGGGTDMPER